MSQVPVVPVAPVDPLQPAVVPAVPAQAPVVAAPVQPAAPVRQPAVGAVAPPPADPNPNGVPRARLFHLVRAVDATGTTGTGVIAIGTEYPSGDCSLAWLNTSTGIEVYESLAAIMSTHGQEGTTVAYV